MAGNTACRSEKDYKRFANRRMRKRTRRMMDAGEFDVLPVRNEIDNIWNWGKDGKTRFDPAEHPRMMRK